jgi:hypothetical protein
MFEYSYKVEKAALFIKTGEMPNPGAPQASISGRSSSCA